MLEEFEKKKIGAKVLLLAFFNRKHSKILYYFLIIKQKLLKRSFEDFKKRLLKSATKIIYFDFKKATNFMLYGVA